MQGKELVKLSDDEIEVIVNFDKTRHGVFTFDISIANNSDSLLMIVPEEFYCTTNSKFSEEIKVNALNPEIMILQNEKQIERVYAQECSDAINETLFSLFDIAEDITNRDKTTEEIEKDKENREDREADYDKSRIRNRSTMDRLSSQSNLLEKHALRRTSLFPGQIVTGKLYFSIPYSIKDLVFRIPFGNGLNLKYSAEKIK